MNSKITKILSWAIMGVVLLLMQIGLYNKNLDLLFNLVYILAVLGIVGVIFGFVFNSITNPQSLIKSGATVVGLLLLFAVAYYGMATNEAYPKPAPGIGAGLSQFIGGMLFITVLLLFLAFLSIVAAWVVRLIR